MLYESEGKSRLRYVGFAQEFSHTVQIPRGTQKNVSVFCKPQCTRLFCRLISPRKPIIKTVIAIEAELEQENPIKALSVSEDSETFFRKKTIGFDGITKRCVKDREISDTLTLSQSEKSIGRIICGSVSLQSPQITLSRGKAELRTTATAHILCEEENGDGRYFATAKTLPVTIELTDDSIDEGKQARAYLAVTEREFTPELDQYGESRNIKAAFTVRAELFLNEQKAYTVAEDMFEKGYDSIPIITRATLPHLHSVTENGFSVESKLTPDEHRPTALLDCRAFPLSSAAIKKEDGVYTEGSFLVSLLASTEQGVKSYDRIIEYSRHFATELPENETSVSAEISPVEVIPTLHADGSVTAKVVAEAKISVYTETEEDFISEVSKRTAREPEATECALVFCYPHKNEPLWSIAKQYRQSPDAISDANPDSFDEQGFFRGTSRPILIKK